jgi:hypothetical protein
MDEKAILRITIYHSKTQIPNKIYFLAHMQMFYLNIQQYFFCLILSNGNVVNYVKSFTGFVVCMFVPMYWHTKVVFELFCKKNIRVITLCPLPV